MGHRPYSSKKWKEKKKRKKGKNKNKAILNSVMRTNHIFNITNTCVL